MVGPLGRCALILEYDGSRYSGYQFQLNGDSVQARLEAALATIMGASVSTKAASRTDAGVHARGQVVAFDRSRPFPVERLAAALNGNLPRDIRVVRAIEVPEDFHPQYAAKGKIYRYFFFNRSHAPAIAANYCWHIPKPLDLQAMNAAAACLRGRHDFQAFQAAGSAVASTVRTLQHIWSQRRGHWVVMTVYGDGFLYNMVRIIAGTIAECGLSKRSAPEVAAALAARDRKLTGPTAPAAGLFLERVIYRPSLDRLAQL
ncbi:MAG: tRNA pseudouridine(38-40) synthase TruA [Firmicutes bacterium]|nr:tRNA pseudouridine(38-40) synthase TruA [Bacillota bacterium]